jgi:hypothetical protein
MSNIVAVKLDTTKLNEFQLDKITKSEDALNLSSLGIVVVDNQVIRQLEDTENQIPEDAYLGWWDFDDKGTPPANMFWYNMWANKCLVSM